MPWGHYTIYTNAHTFLEILNCQVSKEYWWGYIDIIDIKIYKYIDFNRAIKIFKDLPLTG